MTSQDCHHGFTKSISYRTCLVAFYDIVTALMLWKYTHRGIASREGEVLGSLLCTCEAPSTVLQSCRSRSMKVIKGLEHLSYRESLKELGLFSFQKRKLRKDLIVTFQYLKRA